MTQPKNDNSVFWLLVAVVSVTFIVYLLALSCAEVKAEWVRLNEFRGVQTNATFSNIPFNRAQKSVNWTFGGAGELNRMILDIRNTNPRIVNSDPIEWFGPTRNDAEFFFYNGSLKLYNIDFDTTHSVTLSYLDDVRQYASNATIRRNNAASSKWLALSLADITSIHVTSAGFDSTYQTWGGPVNDTTWFIKSNARAMYNSDPDTLTLSSVSVTNTYGPPGIFIANDTTWISDGEKLIKQLGDSSTALTYPTFADTGTTGLVVKYKLYGGGSDSVMIIIDSLPDSAITAVATGRHWYQFVVDSMPRGQPITPYFGNNNGTTDTLYFAADTGMFGAYTGAGPVSHIKLRQGAKFFVTRTTGPNQSPGWPVAWTDTGNWDYRGTIHGLIKWAVWTPNNPGQWFSSIHDFDGRIMIPGGATKLPTRQNVRIISEDGDGATGGTAETLKVVIACDLNVANNDAFQVSDVTSHVMKMYEWPRTTIASTVQDWNWRISCLHRFRAFYAGNPDSLNQLAWSSDNDYDAINGTELLEGDDPITALSSMTDLQVYRRHSIRALQGSAPADFYLLPSPSGVGAVNNATVVRDPYSNTDYFVNELGVWNNNGATVTEVPTACPEIFRDSIDWSLERLFTAAIHDRKYILSCAFPNLNKLVGASDLNRVIIIDLDGSDVTFFDRMNVLSMYNHRQANGGERLYFGDGDTTGLVWVDGSSQDTWYESEWKSAWTDFETPQQTKRISRAGLSGTYVKNDTVFVDFYVRTYDQSGETTESLVWTKTLVGPSVGSGATETSRIVFPVSRLVIGDQFAVGVRWHSQNSNTVAPTLIDAAFDVERVGDWKMR